MSKGKSLGESLEGCSLLCLVEYSQSSGTVDEKQEEAKEKEQ
jgi:hypothetical protein